MATTDTATMATIMATTMATTMAITMATTRAFNMAFPPQYEPLSEMDEVDDIPSPVYADRAMTPSASPYQVPPCTSALAPLHLHLSACTSPLPSPAAELLSVPALHGGLPLLLRAGELAPGLALPRLPAQSQPQVPPVPALTRPQLHGALALPLLLPHQPRPRSRRPGVRQSPPPSPS